ncbi:MAG: hypothetical protein ABL962_08420 [Fimbriimonadaceae bacterium]
MNAASCIPEWVKLFLPPLTTVLVGGVLVQSFFVGRANQAAFVDHIVKELGELRDDALEYWALALTQENRDDVRQLEARIKGRIHSLVSDLNHFRDVKRPIYRRALNWVCDLTPDWLPKPTQEGPRYVQAMLNVYEVCTDGDFETDQHQADPSKYLSICSTISKVKSELLRVKL